MPLKIDLCKKNLTLNPFGARGHSGNWKCVGGSLQRTGFAEEGVKIIWY